MPRLPALCLVILLCAAAPAAAQSTAVVTPDLTHAGTHMRLTLDGSQPPVNGRVPKGLILAAQRGFKFDGKSVKGRCTLDRAQTEGCPMETRVGTGFADVTAYSPLFGSIDIKASIESFLAPRKSKKELSGVLTSLNVLGTQTWARGYVDGPAAGDYGLRVVFDDLPPTPGGFQVTLKRFEVEFGAERDITRTRRVNGKRRRVKEHHAMLRNPGGCARDYWLGRATLRFDDASTGIIDAPIGCHERE
jgi:hypothetical protein